MSDTPWEDLVFDALLDLFGPPIWLAVRVGGLSGFDSDDHYEESMRGELVNDTVLGLIVARLSGADREARIAADDYLDRLMGAPLTRPPPA